MRTAIEHAGPSGLLILLWGDQPQIEAEATTTVVASRSPFDRQPSRLLSFPVRASIRDPDAGKRAPG